MKLLADVAVVDPALTASVSARAKAATGMDVLTHAVEAFVSIKAQSQTSALAVDAIRKVGQHLPRAVEYRGGDDERLRKMARASSQAGMAFNGAGLGAVHAISHQIGGQFAVPHGLANAVLLPYVMEYNLPQVPEKLLTVADAERDGRRARRDPHDCGERSRGRLSHWQPAGDQSGRHRDDSRARVRGRCRLRERPRSGLRTVRPMPLVV